MDMGYIKRNLQAKIDALLKIFPAVLILGARQTGKTTLAKVCRPEWRYFDLEKGSDYDFITSDYDFFFREYPQQLIIDEAQETPQIFKELRGVIDSSRRKKNRFMLTGSSSPKLLSAISDSLAGRIGIIEVGTLKGNEIYAQPIPDFYQIFLQDINASTLDFLKLTLATSQHKHQDSLNHLLKGGYPEPVLQSSDDFFYAWMENYHKTYISTDIRRLYPRLDEVKYRRFISMLASLSGTIVNKAQLGRSIDVSEMSIRDYLDIAHNTYIWRNIPSYEGSVAKSIVKMPKGYFRDSGLLHYLLNITSREQMLKSPNVGQNFESFVIEEIIKGLQSCSVKKWDYYYYRTRNGAEVDLILEGSFGILPIEIKFGTSTRLKQLTSLNKFIEENQLPMGIVINNSQEIKRLNNKIIQIPVNCV